MKSRFISNGRSVTFPDSQAFTTAAGSTADVDDAKYGDGLQSAGWTFVGYVGTTAERPVVQSLPHFRGGAGPHGMPYIDTTVGAIILWDQQHAQWMDRNGAAV